MQALNSTFNLLGPRTIGYALDRKLSETRRDLSLWNRSKFGNIHEKLNNLQQQLTDLQKPDSSRTDSTQVVQKIEKEIEEWHQREKIFYIQKSRETFFHEVDQNTKHFHLQANRIRSRNRIETLNKPDGTWCQGKEQLESLLDKNFKQIMTTVSPDTNDELMNLLPPCITEADNESLTRMPTEEEIYNTLKQMHPWKAPGPDRFPPGFFQANYSTNMVIDEIIIGAASRPSRGLIAAPSRAGSTAQLGTSTSDD
ncbi:uncharacterized protein LOC113280061 [Papaver somniferum]|uniref:uncharacterized protein LOC113280061 n=1 Tax=Papaver somniferum TaxID=3469 RepID=UPI000E6FAFE8|nr:uncharacterized protein LOC113280061 [Papaver somniferum]